MLQLSPFLHLYPNVSPHIHARTFQSNPAGNGHIAGSSIRYSGHLNAFHALHACHTQTMPPCEFVSSQYEDGTAYRITRQQGDPAAKQVTCTSSVVTAVHRHTPMPAAAAAAHAGAKLKGQPPRFCCCCCGFGCDCDCGCGWPPCCIFASSAANAALSRSSAALSSSSCFLSRASSPWVCGHMQTAVEHTGLCLRYRSTPCFPSLSACLHVLPAYATSVSICSNNQGRRLELAQWGNCCKSCCCPAHLACGSCSCRVSPLHTLAGLFCTCQHNL